ncbi:MAG: response regulator [Rhodobacter sp.]|nr:response regulator [Rhodobacter sp.]
MRILIVEDEAEIHRYYSKALKRLGADHDVAESKVEALELLRNRSYEAAIVDLNLTDDQTFSHGKEVLEKVSELNEGTICFVVSGTSKVEDVVDSWQLGAVKFIQKSKTDNQQVAQIVYDAAKGNDLKPYGKFENVESYLGHPSFGSEWEMILKTVITVDFQKMRRTLTAVFDRITPVVRLKNNSASLELDRKSAQASGVFWSKAEGCAVTVQISGSRIETSLVDEDIVVKGDVSGDVFYVVAKDASRSRDEFAESLNDTPWA